MIVIENNCVGCPQGCINCGRRHQEAFQCDGDNCGKYADYQVSGDYDGEYCEDCLNTLLNTIFSELSLSEKLGMLEDYITAERM